jgi:hypothetical protein
MFLSKFEPSEPPLYMKDIMTDIVFLNHHSKITVEKPQLGNSDLIAKPEITIKKFEKVIQPKINPKIKNKMIKKVKS